MYFLGLDLGGTSVKAGIVDEKGALKSQVAVDTGRGPDVVIGNMARAGREAADKAGVKMSEVAGVGIGSPGPLNISRGLVIRCANLPGWENVPLRERIARELGRPTVLENDANAAAFGEYWAGAGSRGNVKDLVMLTLGTGIGGGIIQDGRVTHGKNDFAGEIGHAIMVIDGEACGCGQRGCLEVYASASRLGTRATAILKAGSEASSLRGPLAARGAVTSEDVAKAAAAGDAVALAAWDEACKYLAIACVNVVHVVDPEMIVLAGGMVKAGGLLIDAVRKHFLRQWWKLTPVEVRLELAELGNDAGVIGAAGVAKAAFERGQV